MSMFNKTTILIGTKIVSEIAVPRNGETIPAREEEKTRIATEAVVLVFHLQ